MAKKTSKTGKISTLKVAKSPSKIGAKRTSVKTGKMKVVPKNDVNWFVQAFLFLLNIIVQCIRIPYIILMRFPSQPAYLLGILRVVFWGYLLYFLYSEVNFHDGKIYPGSYLPNNLNYYSNYLSNFFGVPSSYFSVPGPSDYYNGVGPFSEENLSWLAVTFKAIVVIVSTIVFLISLPVAFGLNRGSKVSRGEGHPNIDATIDILDSQLSSYHNRSNFIENLINKKQ